MELVFLLAFGSVFVIMGFFMQKKGKSQSAGKKKGFFNTYYAKHVADLAGYCKEMSRTLFILGGALIVGGITFLFSGIPLWIPQLWLVACFTYCIFCIVKIQRKYIK